jgi:succinate dehydrogenase hydrophobic anchor subunit
MIKSNIKLQEEINMNGNNKKNIIFKCLILVLLALNVFHSFKGTNAFIKEYKFQKKWRKDFKSFYVAL